MRMKDQLLISLSPTVLIEAVCVTITVEKGHETIMHSRRLL